MTTVRKLIEQLTPYANDSMILNDSFIDQLMANIKVRHKIQEKRASRQYIFHLGNFDRYFPGWGRYSEISFNFIYQVFLRSIYIRIDYKLMINQPGDNFIPPDQNPQIRHLENAYESKFGKYMRTCIIHEDDDPKPYVLDCFGPELLNELETRNIVIKTTIDWGTDT